MDALHPVLPPTAPNLKSAFSNLPSDLHDSLRTASPIPPSRGRAPTPKPVVAASFPPAESAPKSPTTAFSNLDSGLREALATDSEPVTPVSEPADPGPAPSTSAPTSALRPLTPDMDSNAPPPHENSPSAVFARLGADVHESLAQDSSPSTPGVVEVSNPLSKSTRDGPESELASGSQVSPLSATFERLRGEGVMEGLERDSRSGTPEVT